MKWLHLSDLHFDPEKTGCDTDVLPERIKKIGIKADHLFFTGDFRNGNQDDSDSVAMAAAESLRRIAESVGISDFCRIHIVPGNHDLTREGYGKDEEGDDDAKDHRKKEGKKQVTIIRKTYETANGWFDKGDLRRLLNRFGFFKKMVKALNLTNVWTDSLLPLHPYACFDDFSLVYLNTAVTCGADDDRGRLVIGSKTLDASLGGIRKENPGKPVIILAHHSSQYFSVRERRDFENNFRGFSEAALYLCGDEHTPWSRNTNNLLELTAGCLTPKTGTQVVFYTGELCNGAFLPPQAHLWDSNFSSLADYPHLNERIQKLVIGIRNPFFSISRSGKTVSNLKDRNTVPLTPHFTGREKELENIRKSFQSGKRIALTQSITGLGGIGKTQLALQYAFDHEKTYEYVWWIDATTETAVIEGYKAFLKEIKFRMGLKASPEECVDYVRRWMSENDNYLFVFDNADSYARDGKPVLPDKMLQDYLPQNLDGNRHILITSRYKNWRKMAQEIDVRVFSLQEARDFLTSYTGLANDSFQDKLAEKLGYLPLALEQAAAYINDKGESYRGYLELFSRHNVELLKPERYPNENDPRRIVYTTWNISRDQIKRESALQLLDLLSFFAPDDIDIRWLQNGAKHLPEPLRTDIQEELECGEVLAELVRYSLITRREEHLSLHRLVQEVIRGSLETEKRNEAAECCLRICNSCIFWDFSTVESRRQFSELQPHLLSVLNASDDHLLETRAILYMFLGKGAEEHGRYDTALEEYEKVLAIRKKNLGPDHPDTATAYNNIAFVYSSKGEYGNALKGFEKALAIREKVLVPNHPSIATTYNDTAMVYSRMGEYDKALEGYEKALAIREKVLGPNDPKTAQIYNNIAVVYSRKGEYGKALGEHEKALAIKEKVLGPDHPKTAITYNNIAGVYFRTGEHEKALEEFEKALAIRDKVLGSEHPDTAISHNNIAMVHDNKGEYDRALEGYQKALVIRERVLGPDHSGTAVIYNGIASVYDNMGKYDKAMEWHEKALAIREKVLGPDHPDTATTYNNIAEVYYKKEKYGKSLGWYVCAFRVFQTKFGDRHPSTKKLYKKMCQAYEESGKTGNFKEWLDGKLAESGRCHQ